MRATSIRWSCLLLLLGSELLFAQNMRGLNRVPPPHEEVLIPPPPYALDSGVEVDSGRLLRYTGDPHEPGMEVHVREGDAIERAPGLCREQ